MKAVIIKGTNGQKLFHIRQDKKGKFTADVLTELDDRVEITVIGDDNKRVNFYPVKNKPCSLA